MSNALLEAFRNFTKKRAGDKPHHYDMVVVGGGPAGLAAAMHGSSENLKVAVLDASDKLGGQALSSRAIENYPGFPNGITGKKLLTHFVSQANKFRTHLIPNATAAHLETEKDGRHIITTEDGRRFASHSIVLSPGLNYNRVPQMDNYEGKGVHYGMPDGMERNLDRQTPNYAKADENGVRHIVVIGAGNSGGQAADRLAKCSGCHVHIVARSDIRDSMSDYLVRRLVNSENVTIHNKAQVERVHGNVKGLTHVQLSNGHKIPTSHAIVYAGAHPRTDWLQGHVEMDEKGYIKTGHHVSEGPITKSGRARLPFETSKEGIFAAGDVRHSSTKRVVAGAGEGAGALQSVHAHREQHPSLQRDNGPATQFFFDTQLSSRYRPIPKKAKPLPPRLKAKKKKKPQRPTMHPNDGMMERAKIASSAARALANKPTVERKKAKLVKEHVLFEGPNAPEKGEHKNIYWHGSKSPEPVTKFHPLSHFGTKNAVRELHGKTNRTKSIHAVRIKKGKVLRTGDINNHEPERLLHHLAKTRPAMGKKPVFSHDEYEHHKTEMGKLNKHGNYTHVNNQRKNEYLAKAIRDKGIHTISYKNRYEDKGKTSYMITHPDQVRVLKSKKSSYKWSENTHKSCPKEFHRKMSQAAKSLAKKSFAKEDA